MPLRFLFIFNLPFCWHSLSRCNIGFSISVNVVLNHFVKSKNFLYKLKYINICVCVWLVFRPRKKKVEEGAKPPKRHPRKEKVETDDSATEVSTVVY